MKKILLSATVLTAVILGGCSGTHKQSNVGLTSKCEEHCNGQGKRVDAQYSEETNSCKCSTDRRTT